MAGAYIYGLPEQKIAEVTMENVHIDYAEDAKPGVAAMMLGCDASCRRGVVAANVEKLNLVNVKIEGAATEPYELINVDSITSK